MPTDDHLLDLLGDLGLRDSITWRRPGWAWWWTVGAFPFNTALDLLRFTPLGCARPAEVRRGVGAAAPVGPGQGPRRHPHRGLVARPLRRPGVGAAAGAAVRREVRRARSATCPRCTCGSAWGARGPCRCAATRRAATGPSSTRCRASIEAGGGVVRLDAPVRRIGRGRRRCGSRWTAARSCRRTTWCPRCRCPCCGSSPTTTWPRGCPRCGCRTRAWSTRCSSCAGRCPGTTGRRWCGRAPSSTALIQMTPLAGVEPYDGRHLVYAMRYTDRESALFQEDDAAIAERWTSQLLALHPALCREDVEDVRVFKAPFVEPVYPLGYLARRPPVVVAGTPLLLATTAHVYPGHELEFERGAVGRGGRPPGERIGRTPCSWGSRGDADHGAGPLADPLPRPRRRVGVPAHPGGAGLVTAPSVLPWPSSGCCPLLAELDLASPSSWSAPTPSARTAGRRSQALAAAGHEIASHRLAPSSASWPRCPTRPSRRTSAGRRRHRGGHRPRPPASAALPSAPARRCSRSLVEGGYDYDASVLPTSSSPLLKVYYRARMRTGTPDQPQQHLFGRPPTPCSRSRRSAGAATAPVSRAAHLDHAAAPHADAHELPPGAGGDQRRGSPRYLRLALRLLRARGVPPSFLLHPTDLLDARDAPRLAFFPGMARAWPQKIDQLRDALASLADGFDVVPLGEAARRLGDADLPVRRVGGPGSWRRPARGRA